jgi:hypothetical protein
MKQSFEVNPGGGWIRVLPHKRTCNNSVQAKATANLSFEVTGIKEAGAWPAIDSTLFDPFAHPSS